MKCINVKNGLLILFYVYKHVLWQNRKKKQYLNLHKNELNALSLKQFPVKFSFFIMSSEIDTLSRTEKIAPLHHNFSMISLHILFCENSVMVSELSPLVFILWWLTVTVQINNESFK